MPSRITSACWSSDGTTLALGLLNGLISVRNQQAEEVLRVERRAPIWTLTFIPDLSPPTKPAAAGGVAAAGPTAVENKDLLVVGCWDKTFSLYK
jgi:hypothetical protein